MATPLSAQKIVDVLRAEGLVVHEVRDWRNHNRNRKGAWGPVNGVVVHHTVTSSTSGTVDLCYDGYAALPGPLCLGVIDKQGEVWLVGCGRANHAGSGDDDVLKAVINESYGDYPPKPNESNTDGNSRFYGFECINKGDGRDPWPAAQLEAIEKASAALCRAHGWGAKSVIGHKEWTNQKVDPRGFDMKEMRDRISDRLAGNQQEEEVALSSEDVRKLWNTDGVIPSPNSDDPAVTNKYWMPSSYLVGLYKDVQNLKKQIDTLSVAGVDLGQLAAAVSADPGLAEAIAERVAEKLVERLAE